jgi:hypothetical protein
MKILSSWGECCKFCGPSWRYWRLLMSCNEAEVRFETSVFINLYGFKTQKAINLLQLLYVTNYCNIIWVTFDDRQIKPQGLDYFNFNSTPHYDIRTFRLQRDKYSWLHCNEHYSIVCVDLGDFMSFITDVVAPAVFADGCKRVWRHLLSHVPGKCKVKAECPSETLVITYQGAHWCIRPKSELFVATKLKCEGSYFLCGRWPIKWIYSRGEKLQFVTGTVLRIAKSN